MLGRLVMAATLATLFSGSALAAEAKEQDFHKHAVENPQMVKGQALNDMAGTTIGEIENVVRDEGTGNVYLIVRADQYLRSGNGLTAVGLKDVRWRNERIVLISRGTNLPLAINGYDETQFKDFTYTSD